MTGNTWTAVRFFCSFEEADTLRKSLKTGDLSGTLQVKVKRCGVSGVHYVVKTRQSAELAAATASLDEAVDAQPVKKTRKKKE